MTDNNKEFFTQEILSELLINIGVAFWFYNLKNDEIHYNDAFFDLIGVHGEDLTIETWNEMIHPEDKDYAFVSLDDYVAGKIEQYNVEMRMVKKDGTIMWLHDCGKVTRYDEDGKPEIISGITQDITKRKMYEEKLSKEEANLKLAMRFASFSVWEWNLVENTVVCNDGYAKSLGYDDHEWFNTTERWATIIHPDDAIIMKKVFEKCIAGGQKSYDHKVRVRKNDGEFIWVRDMGEVSKVDENNKPTQIIGGRFDINELELAKIKLESYQNDLELQIKARTEELMQRDKVLIELNHLSQKIVAIPTGDNFDQTAYDYLEDFNTVQKASRLAIFRKKEVDGKVVCYLANNPKSKYRTQFSLNYIREVFKDVSVEFLSKGGFKETQREEFYEIILKKSESVDFNCIDFENDFPFIAQHVLENKIINKKSIEFPAEEFIFTQLQSLKTIVMSPILINNEFWGFILFDDYENKSFSEEDEKTLSLLGSMIAQAIHKNDVERIASEAIEHNELMLNALPVCSMLLDNGKCITVNDEAIRLFNLKSRDEFIEKFDSLSPEYQPCGKKSKELLIENCKKVFEEGKMRFEWSHNDLEGNPIPCEVTLVKIRYGNKDLIAKYCRDLRDFKKLMNQIEENQEVLRQAHEEALLSSQAKSNFLANMSHEIRTPMNAISGMADIILRENTDTEVNEYALNIRRASESLLAIINDVLDISKIESGKLDIVEGEYKLTNVLNDVLTIATNRLELKPLMFTTNFQSNLPNELIGDDVRIKQIMVNILNNAIKFTSEGCISFDVSGDFAGGIMMLKFSVTDTGSGISEEDMEKLFIEFERVDTKKNRTIEGTGLGLAISKRLCEMMNGEIIVTSEIGVGTTFTVTVMQKYENYNKLANVEKMKSILIFESRDMYRNSIEQACRDLNIEDLVLCSLQSEFNEALQERSFDYIFTSSMYLTKVQEMLSKKDDTSKIVLLADTADIKSKYDYTTIILPTNTISIANVLNGKTVNIDDTKSISDFTAPACNVLVVDDNAVNLKVAQGLMRPYQFKIQTAENGHEAVEKIKNNKYDIVFMDHMMPVMDGIDATIAVREIEGEYYKNLPIIALTANAIIGTKEMFINEGMNDFLAKPIKLSALNDLLAKWLPKEKQIDNNPNEISDDENEEKAQIYIENLDSNLGINRVGGDFETYVDILNMYYKDGLKRIPNIRNLYDSKKILEYKIEVHALKSASASVGAIDISEKARQLEEASIKEDWAYIDKNTIEFIDEFNILLENIREALKGLISEVDTTGKENGDYDIFIETLNELLIAIDSVDINRCDELLDKIFSYKWQGENLENLLQIKEHINSYEYDEAVEIIQMLV